VHPDQLTVPAATVRTLVDTQFPAWRDLPVTRVAVQGTVNAIFRLGDRLAALVDRGRLAGVLDVGGLGPADPALDLVAAWHLIDPGPRQILRNDLGPSELAWKRGRAWAFVQAMGAVWYYVDSNPPMSRMGRRTLERVVAS
jgi:aminoglycoside phosphotransferase (APT) family kinase protein